MAQRFAFKKVQFTLGSADSQHQSKGRKDCSFFGTAQISDEPEVERV
jgi:hypothetical protein